MAAPINLAARRGDTNIFTIPVKRQRVDGEGNPIFDSDGKAIYDPVDLNNAKIWFYAKRKATDSDVAAVIAKGTANTTIGSGIVVLAPTTDGIAELTIDPDDTDDLSDYGEVLKYDIQVEEAVTSRVTTVAWGTFLITPDTGNATT